MFPLAGCSSSDDDGRPATDDEAGNTESTTGTTGDTDTDSEAGTTADTETSDSDTSDSDTSDSDTSDETPPECGNEVVEGDEECDDGAESVNCDADCTLAACGDGYLNMAAGEACDDGNDVDDDGCNNMCLADSCGDGVVDEGEACDDGNGDQTDECAACQVASCGDGYTQAGVEACDDGNDVDSDACTSTCVEAACGDGFIQEGVEECDDGNDVDSDACPSSCSDAVCGDGFVQEGMEECDDGNDIDDDACTNECLASCGDDCWGDDGCLTDQGHCIRFTCAGADDTPDACDSCFGWEPVTYQQWLNDGYCGDLADKYRDVMDHATQCGNGATMCCSDPNNGCNGNDNAWHLVDGQNTRLVGPCLGCQGVDNCTNWDTPTTGTYTRITACERSM